MSWKQTWEHIQHSTNQCNITETWLTHQWNPPTVHFIIISFLSLFHSIQVSFYILLQCSLKWIFFHFQSNICLAQYWQTIIRNTPSHQWSEHGFCVTIAAVSTSVTVCRSRLSSLHSEDLMADEELIAVIRLWDHCWGNHTQIFTLMSLYFSKHIYYFCFPVKYGSIIQQNCTTCLLFIYL